MVSKSVSDLSPAKTIICQAAEEELVFRIKIITLLHVARQEDVQRLAFGIGCKERDTTGAIAVY